MAEWQPVPDGVDVTASPDYPEPPQMFEPRVDRRATEEPIGEVVARFRAALDEEERIAVQASFGLGLDRHPEWRAEEVDERDPEDGSWRRRWAVVGGQCIRAHTGEVSPRWATHIARQDPATTLARVTASRQILALWQSARDLEAETAAVGGAFGRGMTAGLERAVRALAGALEGDR